MNKLNNIKRGLPALIMCFSLCGCGNSSQTDGGNSSDKTEYSEEVTIDYGDAESFETATVEETTAYFKPVETTSTTKRTTSTTRKTTTTVEETTVSFTEPPTETTATPIDGRKAVENGDYSLVTPEFKATMDAYEAFYNDYIAFMNRYSSGEGDIMSMMDDYMTMLDKMTEWSNKIDAIDEKSLSPADDAYYLLVTMRIEQKLLGSF